MLVKGNQTIILDTATKYMFSCFLLLFFFTPLELIGKCQRGGDQDGRKGDRKNEIPAASGFDPSFPSVR